KKNVETLMDGAALLEKRDISTEMRGQIVAFKAALSAYNMTTIDVITNTLAVRDIYEKAIAPEIRAMQQKIAVAQVAATAAYHESAREVGAAIIRAELLQGIIAVLALMVGLVLAWMI